MIFYSIVFLSCNTTKIEKKEIIDFSELNNIDSSVVNQLALSSFIKGTKYHNQRKYKDAVLEYLDAMRYDSSFATHYAIAKSFRELKKYKLAEDHLIAAINKKPNFTDALELLAEIQFLDGFANNEENIKKSIVTLKKLIDIKPTYKNKYMLANIYEYYDIDEAIKIYEKLINNEFNQTVFNKLRDLYISQNYNEKYYELLKSDFIQNEKLDINDINELFKFYNKNLEIEKIKELLKETKFQRNNDDLKNFYINSIYNIIEDSTKYFNEIANVLISDMENEFISNSAIQYALGALNLKLNNIEIANKHYNRSVNFADFPYEVAANIAVDFFRFKKYDYSINYYKKSSMLKENSRSLLMISYIYFYELNNSDSSLYYAKKAYKYDKNDLDVLINIAAINDEIGNFIKSEKYYSEALKIAPFNPTVNNNYAYSLSNRKKNLEIALKMSKIALQSEPENAVFLDTYGWVLFNMGNYSEALQYIEKAVQKDDSNAEVFEHLGDIYIKLYKIEKAVDAYKKGFLLNPDSNSLKEKIKKYEDD